MEILESPVPEDHIQAFERAPTLRMPVIEFSENQKRVAASDLLEKAAILTSKEVVFFQSEKRRLHEEQLKINPSPDSFHLTKDQQVAKFNILMQIIELRPIEEKLSMLLASLELNKKKIVSDQEFEQQIAVSNLEHLLNNDIAELQKDTLSVLADKPISPEYLVRINELAIFVRRSVDAVLQNVVRQKYD